MKTTTLQGKSVRSESQGEKTLILETNKKPHNQTIDNERRVTSLII